MQDLDLTNVLTDHGLRKQVGFTIIEAAVFEQIDVFKKSILETAFGLNVSRATVYNAICKIQQKGYLKYMVSSTGKIYLAIDENTGYHKIGWSINPRKREKTLQSEKPTIFFLWVINGSKKDESYLHRLFSSKRIRGEWFDLDKQDIEMLVNEADIINNKNS
jgi:hypothetical protein